MEGPLKSSSRTSGRAENVAPNRLTGQCPLNGGSSVDAKNAAVIQTGGVGLPRGSEKKESKIKKVSLLCRVYLVGKTLKLGTCFGCIQSSSWEDTMKNRAEKQQRQIRSI